MPNIFDSSVRFRASQPRAAAVVDAMQIVRAAWKDALCELPAPNRLMLWREGYAQVLNLPSAGEKTGVARLERVQRYLRTEYAEAIREEPVPVASWASRMELGVAYGDA